MRNSLQLLVLFVLAGVLLSGCGGGGSTPPPGGNGTGNPLPSVTSLSPASATAGGAAFTLTVTGSNFVSGTVVNWAGAGLTTTFVSSTSVTASVPASDLNTAGTAQVTLTNPTPGGGSSAAKTFNINNPAPAVTSLSQTSANAGSSDFTLTITGSGFVATSVVNWNSSARTTTFGSGTQLTASISEADLAIAGSAHVSVSNPTPGGGSSGNLTFTITPQIANGNGLSGDPNSLAINATADLRESDIDGSAIRDGILMTRLDVRFAADATVGQVNGALGSIGAGIVSMSQGFTSMTIGIPRQTSLENLEALVAELEASPGIHHVAVANVAAPEAIFPTADLNLSGMAAKIRHLLPSRFPAAWNVVRTDTLGDPSNPKTGFCAFTPIPVVVPDIYFLPPFPDVIDLFGQLELPNAPLSNPPTDMDLGHGYDVTQVLGANAFGANPFSRTSECVDIHLVQAFQVGLTETELTNNFFANMPPAGTKFIVNTSLGHPGCADKSQCKPPHDNFRLPINRAYDALYWKERTRNRWGDFLIVTSAGNKRDEDVASIYPGTADARFNSSRAISQLTDTSFGFVADNSLWTPSANDQARGFVSVTASAVQMNNLANDLLAAGFLGPDSVADNVIVAGSATSPSTGTELTQHVTGDQLAESNFSNSGPDVLAVGENVLNDHTLEGTSFAAPQVAGLASYLWMVSSELFDQPVSTTKQVIVANTRNKVIDAYAAVLALDAAALPDGQNFPIRQTLLDVNHNNRFDEGDLDMFLRHLFKVDPQGNITHQAMPGTTADFSRFDLNGDGFTTAGALRERFDLDRTGSTQFGATLYSDVPQKIEGTDIDFDESAVTDLEILCYYAYSPMYIGDTDARRSLLAGRCGLAVQPAKVNLVPNQTQQFTANTPANDPVQWTASCGTIDPNSGLYTAGNDVGPCTVRATDVNDPSLSGTAEVTLISGTFSAEAGYTASISALDHLTGIELFPAGQLSASNTSNPLTLGPLDLRSPDNSRYQAPGGQPVTYSVSAHADGPIVGHATVNSSGTFTATIHCSADGDVLDNGDGTFSFPFMPDLKTSSGGNLEVTVPVGGLSFSASGSLSRGTTTDTESGNLDMNGQVEIDFENAGGPTQSLRFPINDGTMLSGNTPAEVPFNQGMRLSQPGEFDVHWGINAHCFAHATQDKGLHVARNATLTVTYTLAH